MKQYGGVSAELAAVDGRKRLNMDKLMTVICFILLLIIVVIPIVMIIYNAFFNEGKLEIDMFVEQITEKKNLEAMWNTLKIAVFATILGTIMGVFYAWLLGRSDIPAKGLMRALFNIPYMFPPFLGAMAWDMMFNGRSGYINKMLVNVFHLKSMPININSVWGIVFVEVSYYFPFVFMQVVSALERMDPTLEESARIAGAKQGQVILKITLPLVKPAISALAHFGVPSILGYAKGIYTLPTRIYAVIYNSGGSFDGIRQGAALSVMLVVVVAIALILQNKILSSGSYDIIKGKSMRPTLIKLRGYCSSCDDCPDLVPEGLRSAHRIQELYFCSVPEGLLGKRYNVLHPQLAVCLHYGGHNLYVPWYADCLRRAENQAEGSRRSGGSLHASVCHSGHGSLDRCNTRLERTYRRNQPVQHHLDYSGGLSCPLSLLQYEDVFRGSAAGALFS